MKLTTQQKDRAAGVLLGQAIGDALGVPYEFGPKITAGQARMIGGGLGPYAPGEWSDDTQMAICIARVSATGVDLTTDAALDEVAQGFLDWQTGGASDIGNQTRSVLTAARRATGPLARRMTAAALSAAQDGRAGNGALMRTGIVGLVALDDPEATAEAARRVGALTHADDRCLDSCVLWSEAVRVAVADGRLDVRAGLPLLPEERRAQWLALIDQAETQAPETFGRNGYTVTAFQAAWSAIHTTRDVEGPDHVEAALQRAIAIGHDTDTIAAIAGALLGARYGVSGLRADLARRVHGWPGFRARDLVRLALATGTGGDTGNWLEEGSMVRGDQQPLGITHPDDLDVILGTEADLARCAELGITAVVSLSRVGDADIRAASVRPGNHIEVWLVDSEDPTKNANLAWTLQDAARIIDQLRAEGERVLVHCMAAEHRTPAVALAYSLYVGQTPKLAQRQIAGRFHRQMGGLLWETASRQTHAPKVASHNLAGALAAYRDGRGTYEEVKEAVRVTNFRPRPRPQSTGLAALFEVEEYTVVPGSFTDTVTVAYYMKMISREEHRELRAIYMERPAQERRKATRSSEVLGAPSPTGGDQRPYERGVLLRDQELASGVRSLLRAWIDDDGCLHLDGQDLGLPRGSMSDDEYEYFRTIAADDIPALIHLLGAQPKDDVLALLGRDWSSTRSFDLERRLRDAPFRTRLQSR